ncbi:MAG: type II toxin-antitoxin system RelE/ParE family toxin, partial [Acidobacteria bacterium]|nr:type II toxin-antitoxin system RelE/ParE family toxin [Acidobacteriota bacterium]
MATSFAARYTRQFAADLRKLEPSVQARILRAIETKLLKDPFQYSRKLAGKSGPGRWRFRVGDYRIRFDIEGRLLHFYRVRHRREVY